MYNLSTKALEGPSSQRRPTQAHEDGKQPKRRRGTCFFNCTFYFLFFILPAGCTTPTTPLFGVDDSHESPRRPQQPTKAHAGPRRGKTAHMYVFFNSVFFNLFFIFYITSRLHHTHYTPLWRGRQPRKPTKAPAANEGRRRPTKRENGPYVCFFLIMYFFKNLQLIHKSIPKPTATDDGQRRPTQARSSPRKANAGPRRPTAPNNHRYVFFIMYFF